MSVIGPGTAYVIRQWQGGHVEGVTRQLEAEHVPYRIVEAWDHPVYPRLQPGDAVISLGGPGTVNDLANPSYDGPLREEARFLQDAERQHIPYLGICLGHQLKARVDGNPIGQQDHFVFGIQPVELTPAGRQHWLFKGMPSKLMVYEAHHDEVMSVAPGAQVLATSPNSPIEAVAWNDNSVSVQFHPDALNSKWIDEVENPQALAASGRTVAEHLQHVPPDYPQYLGRFMDNFLTHAGLVHHAVS